MKKLWLSFQNFLIYHEGVNAYKKGDYLTALCKWQPLAEKGHANAQNNLGIIYHEGNGVPQDYKKAAHWFECAAEQGRADIQSFVGVMYREGKGVPQDYKTAVQ